MDILPGIFLFKDASYDLNDAVHTKSDPSIKSRLSPHRNGENRRPAYEYQIPGKWHGNFRGERNTGAFYRHKQHNTGITQTGYGSDYKPGQNSNNFFNHASLPKIKQYQRTQHDAVISKNREVMATHIPQKQLHHYQGRYKRR